MLFTSPVFLLLFIPLMLASYAILPQNLRRAAICFYSVSFYVLANLKRPVCILFMLMAAVFTYCGSFAVAGTRRRGALIFSVMIPLTTLVLVRILTYASDDEALRYLPIGASFCLLASISCVADIWRHDAPVPSFTDALLYISYFPVMIAGPLIRYKDFVKLTDRESIRFTSASVAGGIELFVIGFIKRVAIAEVLNDGYDRLRAVIVSGGPDEGVDLLLALGLGVLILLTTYFSFSGYSDMGRGLSLMLGIPLGSDFGSVLLAVTPGGYSLNFMRSLRVWIDDYLLSPVCGSSLYDADAGGALRGAAACVGFAAAMLWFRSSPSVVLLMLPLLIFVFFGAAYPAVGRFMRRNLPLRLLGRIMTSAMFALFFISVQTGDPAALLRRLGTLTVFAPLQSYSLYLTVFNREYLLIAFLILFCRFPFLLEMLSRYRPGAAVFWRRHGTQAAWAAALMLIFVFTVAFIMPRYPSLASTPFNRIYL